jgi:acyl-coenzyme A thioesterase PaaI-like protein
MDTGTGNEGDDSAQDGPAHTSEARLALADSLRRLGNGLVARQPDDDLMRRITAQVDEWLDEFAEAPERPHAFHVHEVPSFSGPVPENLGSIIPPNAFPDCVVSGMANPMGIAAKLWREKDEAVCQVTLGEAFEGAPGRAHGGIVASIIDETMGLAMSLSQTPAFTGRLTVTYRAPTPVGQPLEVRARLSDRSGRKMIITAELRAADQLLAEAEGLFITVTPRDFFRASRQTGTAAAGVGE